MGCAVPDSLQWSTCPSILNTGPLLVRWGGTLEVLGGKFFFLPLPASAPSWLAPLSQSFIQSPITDLVYYQEVLYGFPVGKDYISCVLHSLRQDLLHFLCDDTWGQAKGVLCDWGSCP